MKTISMALALAASSALGGCVTTENVHFNALANQSAIVKDGRPAIVSKKPSSVVLLSPATRGMKPGARVVYVMAATNLGNQPVDLRISDISVAQITASGAETPLQVIPYEQLASEEKTRQVIGALAVGLAAGANSYTASRAGYGTVSGTVNGPYGARYVTANYYSPTAAAIAQSNASAENSAMIANTIENGQRSMARLEATVLKDNTIMPGEWIGGQVHFAPPIGDAGQEKRYSISVRVGPDTHTFEVSQVAAPE
jgi:hypothetical protein